MSEYLNEMVGYQVEGTADWRGGKAEQFPHDTRNLKAAEELERLAAEINALNGSEIERQISRAQDDFNDLDSGDGWIDINETVSAELRAIGFHVNYNTAQEFLEWYRDLLNAKAKERTQWARNNESRIRRLASRKGYHVHKSRERSTHADNLGLYMLVGSVGSANNVCMLGSRYDATLDSIEAFLDNA